MTIFSTTPIGGLPICIHLMFTEVKFDKRVIFMSLMCNIIREIPLTSPIQFLQERGSVWRR